MAEKKKRPVNKSRKKAFYKSKGLWLSLLLFVTAATVFSYVFVEQYTRPYRERALTYDLDRINDLELPSLILIDVDMPELDGFATTRRLKSDAVTRDIPVVFVTGRNQKADMAWGRILGARGYISKPYSRAQVLEQLGG